MKVVNQIQMEAIELKNVISKIKKKNFTQQTGDDRGQNQ